MGKRTRNGKKRRPRKRRRVGRGRIAQSRYSLTRSTGPIPTVYKTVLRYAEHLAITPAGLGDVASYAFRANDCFDPDFGLGGHQPMGFDQLMVFYHQGLVLYSTITLTINNQDGDQAAVVGVVPGKSALVAGTSKDVNNICENRKARSTIVSGSNGGGSKRVTYKICPYKWLGCTSPMSDPGQHFTTVGSPTDTCLFNVFAFMLDRNAISSGKVEILVQIDYAVLLFEPRNILAPS